MKNKFTFLPALFLLLTIGFGCSYIDNLSSGGNSSNSSSTSNSSTNSADPNAAAKTGVAECDEFLDLLNNDTKKPDEDILTRKFRELAIEFAKESIKKNIEENQGDKQKIADGCKKAKDDYLKKKDEKNPETQKDSNNSQKM